MPRYSPKTRAGVGVFFVFLVGGLLIGIGIWPQLYYNENYIVDYCESFTPGTTRYETCIAERQQTAAETIARYQPMIWVGIGMVGLGVALAMLAIRRFKQ
jgi:hypothetical protein